VEVSEQTEEPQVTEPPDTEPLEPDTETDEPGVPDELAPDATEPEPEQGDEQEQDATEPPAEPSSFAISQEQEKRLAAEVKRHTSRITDILGDAAADAIVCPVCSPDLQGFMYEQDFQHPTNEVQARMFAAIQPAPNPGYLSTPGLEECSVCGGLGSTERPTKVEAHKLAVCSNCNGYGFYPPPGVVTNGALSQDAGLALVAAAHEPVMDDVDAFGSPRLLATGMENPNYGRMPQYKSPEFP
jgi:hypothetical protein